jgi:hypothetical protein
MNTVTISDTQKTTKYTLAGVLNSGHTAFIGQCGEGPANSLYLITYNQIVLANDPHDTWTSDCAVEVARFVDVEIRVL